MVEKLFGDAAAKAGEQIRKSALLSMILWALILFIAGIVFGVSMGKTFLGILIGLIAAVIAALSIRNSVLYKLAIMDACRKITEEKSVVK